jgi:Zn-dependent protease
MDMSKFTTFFVVLIGWVFSLCLHEFSHALVAYYGGDYTVKDKGYLTFNPLKYTHPVYSILLPLLFLALGGIGLPGGAVYIETWRLRSRAWMTAVSLAGPVSNIVLALVLAAALHFAPASSGGIWPGLAFLTYLQVTAALFNLIPLPPFDGYGAVRPHLAQGLRETLDSVGQFSIFVILILFWYVPLVGNGFWGAVSYIAHRIGVPIELAALGQSQFMFWR